MMKSGENPYKFARKRAGLPVMALCDRCYREENWLRNIERGKTRPTDDDVREMIGLYHAPWLRYEHARHISELVAEFLPPLDLGDLSGAYVRMSKETGDVLRLKPDIEACICDGVIDDAERPVMSEIARESIGAAVAYIAFAMQIAV